MLSLHITFFPKADEGRALDIMKFYELYRANWNSLGAYMAPYAANAFPSASWECFWRYVSVLTPAVNFFVPLRPSIRSVPGMSSNVTRTFSKFTMALGVTHDDLRKISY